MLVVHWLYYYYHINDPVRAPGHYEPDLYELLIRSPAGTPHGSRTYLFHLLDLSCWGLQTLHADNCKKVSSGARGGTEEVGRDATDESPKGGHRRSQWSIHVKSLDKRTSEGQKDVSIRVYARPILKSLCRERRKYIPGMGKSEIAKESQKMLESPWMAGYIRMGGWSGVTATGLDPKPVGRKATEDGAGVGTTSRICR